MGCPVTGAITLLKAACLHAQVSAGAKGSTGGSLKSAEGSSCQAECFMIVKWCGGVSAGSVDKQRHPVSRSVCK